MRKEDKEYLDLLIRGLKAEVTSCHDIINYKLDEVIKHQIEQNDRTGKLEDYTQFAQWVQKRPRIAILSLIALVVFFVFIANVFEIGEIIRMWLFKV